MVNLLNKRVIRKYKGRKLYDINNSKIITLSEFASIICNDCELLVLDHNSHDVTLDAMFKTASSVLRNRDKSSSFSKEQNNKFKQVFTTLIKELM